LDICSLAFCFGAATGPNIYIPKSSGAEAPIDNEAGAKSGNEKLFSIALKSKYENSEVSEEAEVFVESALGFISPFRFLLTFQSRSLILGAQELACKDR